MTKFFRAFFAVLLLSGAASAQADWRTIEGQRSGIRVRRLVTIRDSSEWVSVWKAHQPGAPVPAVDFTKEAVVAVFLGETAKAGVKVVVTVQEDKLDDRLNVFYKEVAPLKAGSAMVMSSPYAIVKVRKAAVVAFEADAKIGVPEQGPPVRNVRDERKVRTLRDTLRAPEFD